MMHSFAWETFIKFLTGKAADIIKLGGWNMESIAKQYVGATCSGQVQGGKRKWGKSYAEASYHCRQRFLFCFSSRARKLI